MSEAAGSPWRLRRTMLPNTYAPLRNRARNASSQKDERSGTTNQHYAADHISTTPGRTRTTARVSSGARDKGMSRFRRDDDKGYPAARAALTPLEKCHKSLRKCPKDRNRCLHRLEPEVSLVLAFPTTPPSGRHVRSLSVVAPAPSSVRDPVGGKCVNGSDLDRGRLAHSGDDHRRCLRRGSAG